MFLNFSNEKLEYKIVLLNTNLNKRDEVVSLRVNTPHLDVIKTSDGSFIKHVQINLVWPNTDGGYLTEKLTDRLLNKDDLSFGLDFDSVYFELLFEVSLDPLSMTTFNIRKKADSEPYVDRSQKVTFYSPSVKPDILKIYEEKIQKKISSPKLTEGKIQFKQIGDSDEPIKIKIGNDHEAHFSSKTGFLENLISLSKTVKTKIKLVKYGTTSSTEKSGAYLFLPDGPAQHIDPNLLQWIRVEHDGLLRNRVCINMTIVLHCVEIYPTITEIKQFKTPFFSVWNVVDLRQSHNYELAMHIETDIKNQETVYTDLNGFQYTKRKRYDKLTIQGNVYPMPSGSFIQDSEARLSVLSAQPLGVASLDPSSIQIFLDRRLDQDDNRGMEQSMNDNVVVSNRFIIFYENINGDVNSPAYDHASLMSQLMSFDLLNPVVKLVQKTPTAVSAFKKFPSSKQSFPCDLRLVNMRSMQTGNEEPIPGHVGLILHRVAYEDCPSTPVVQLSSYLQSQCDGAHSNKFKFEDFFEPSQKGFSIANTYLTLGLKHKNENLLVNKNDAVLNFIQPMQIEAFRVNFN